MLKQTCFEKYKSYIEKYDIKTIAPGYGKLFCGKDLVEKQFVKLDAILAEFDVSNAKAYYVSKSFEVIMHK